MDLGMYTGEISRPTIGALFDVIEGYGFTQVQFDFISVYEEQMPESIPPELAERVKNEAKQRDIEIISVNGTFNMIHPDVNVRKDGLKRFETLASVCKKLGCKLITLCTGSRDSKDMWTWHKDNSTDEAWTDLTETMESALSIAEKFKVSLGLECEASNVVNNARKARRLLDEMKSPWLKVVMDGANLFQKGEAFPGNVQRILKSAFDLLGNEIILAHGKDITAGQELNFTSAGRGIIDFDYFIGLLHEYGYKGGIVLHGMKSEDEFPFSVDFMKRKIITV